MDKIIAREIPPEHIDFSFYFDGDCFTEKGGENCAVYIPDNNRLCGFNNEEYQHIIEDIKYILNEYNDSKKTMRAILVSLGGYSKLLYNTHKLRDLKAWAKSANPNNTDSVAEFLTITTGELWKSRAFIGYSQGDYCDVIYCTAHHSDAGITEIGKFKLGCGTEFEIDGDRGYFIIDEIRWKEDDELLNLLAEYSGIKPENLEIQLYTGSHTVPDYKTLSISA